MKNLDLLSKRILVVALSLTMIMCSASLFINSTKTANALPISIKEELSKKTLPSAPALGPQPGTVYPFGIANGNIYFLKVETSGDMTLYQVALSTATK
jgi:hypothetical protein